jgi:crotonobetainyl-CoA:carnitine CoA-transferase CaiB-like acyl-CoA transferase
VFISVETDEQWQGLRRVLGDPAWACDPRYDTEAGRRAAQDELDTRLSAWCATRESDEIIGPLLAAGVPAARVLHQHEPGESPQEIFREFFEPVEHPLIGTTVAYGYPAKLTAGPAKRNRSHAPLLGEHNETVLTEVIGLSKDEVAALDATGVIGVLPSGGTAW